MSAVIAFPTNPRAVSERRVALKNALDERAKATHATSQQRAAAIAAGIAALDGGRSLGWAIQQGYNELPSVQRQVYRQPTSPDSAA